MRNSKWIACCLGSALTLVGLPAGAEQGAPSNKAAEKATEQDLVELADEAYVYALPLMLLDATTQAVTNVASPTGHRAPWNQFARVDVLPDAKFSAVVLPNVDTLYTSAMLDLSREPVVLHVPDTQGRYYLMPMLDAYTNVFAAPGKRTTGTGELKVAIVGPHFKGKLPKGLTKIEAPTDRVWLLGRTQINGKEDLPKVIELTNKYTLTPLSAYGKAYLPPKGRVDPEVDMQTPPPRQIANLGDQAYFERAALLLKQFPPPAADKPQLARFAKLGFGPGKFMPSPEADKAIQGTGARATKLLKAHLAEIGQPRNGWRLTTEAGSYGTNYEVRAAVALWALGANLPEDALYPATSRDAEGQPLNGNHRYVIHFPKGQEPPAHAFWSLSMYNGAGYFVDNPIGRYAIGSRDALQRNPDGSLDLLLQSDAPQGELLANWLPTPQGPFQLLMRIYWPDQKVMDGAWELPAVIRLKP
ncbi:MAG: DUF1254 domain-containing protein [Myxococcales bacterium]